LAPCNSRAGGDHWRKNGKDLGTTKFKELRQERGGEKKDWNNLTGRNHELGKNKPKKILGRGKKKKCQALQDFTGESTTHKKERRPRGIAGQQWAGT